MTLSQGDVNNTLSEYSLISRETLNRANVAERERRCSQADNEREEEEVKEFGLWTADYF